jgi:hypothetical protein
MSTDPTAIDPSMVANLVKFKLCSDKWKPVNTTQLGFDAFVQKCSDPMRVKVGRGTLVEIASNVGVIDALDELTFVTTSADQAPVTLEGFAKFSSSIGPPTFEEIVAFGQLEGIEFTELWPRRGDTHAVDR